MKDHSTLINNSDSYKYSHTFSDKISYPQILTCGYGSLAFDEVWKNDKKQYHRYDLPAVIRYNNKKDRRVIQEYYFNNGVYHRVGGPAIIFYNKDGVIIYEEFSINGDSSFEDKPSAIQYINNTKEFIYYVNNRSFYSISERNDYKKLLLLS